MGSPMEHVKILIKVRLVWSCLDQEIKVMALERKLYYKMMKRVCPESNGQTFRYTLCE